MRAMKRITSTVFVMLLLVVNWHFLATFFAYLTVLTTDMLEPDRGETLPLLPSVVAAAELQIARGGEKRSGLWIVCSKGRHIRLALNTRLPVEKRYLGNGTFSGRRAHLSIFAADVPRSQAINHASRVEFKNAVLRRDNESDVVLTPPLLAEDVRVLSAAFSTADPVIVRWSVDETGTGMSGVADGRAIAKFAADCRVQEQSRAD